MIHTLSDNGYDVQSNDFVCDMAFISESLRALLYRQVGLKHPLGDIMPELINAEINDENKVTTAFDMERTLEILDYIKDDDPKVS